MKKLSEIKKGAWFRHSIGSAKCKYFGECACDMSPTGRAFLFRRDNGQGYFAFKGDTLVHPLNGAGGEKTLKNKPRAKIRTATK